MAKKIAIKIYVDDASGEVETIEITKRFQAEGALFRMDMLSEAILALDHIYNYEKGRFFNSSNEIGLT